MKALLVNNPDGQKLQAREDLVEPEPGPGQVKVKVRCVSLNRRDLAFLNRTHPHLPDRPIVPCSDMAGRVVAMGPGVDNIAEGTAVVSVFLPGWESGRPAANAMRPAFGGPNDGVASEYVVVDAEAVLQGVPGHLNAFESSCLPCAGLTAWAAVTAGAPETLAGRTVVIPGTGGVATFAMQFAKAMGAKVVVISGSPAKHEQARALGADEVINYREQPDWGEAVLSLTDGAGADLVIDHGERQSFSNAIACIGAGGTISLVGGATTPTLELPLRPFFTKVVRLQGIAAGSRQMMRDMFAFIDEHKLRPVYEEPYNFAQAAEAFERLERGDAFGNICLSMTT